MAGDNEMYVLRHTFIQMRNAALPLNTIYWQQLNFNIMEYMVYFYEDVETEQKLYQRGDVIKVNQEEMFKWIQKAYFEKIKISIYTCKMVCDLS